MVERFEFYERAKKCFAVVRKFDLLVYLWENLCILGTGESAIYANIILKKGIVVTKKQSKNENEDGAE
jgi:L-fucose mutarotase/ribose pyranase (RbsD/FucU family)